MTNLWSDLLVQSPKRLKWPRIRLNALAVVAMAVCFFASLAAGQNDRPSNTGEHWVATWATAQQLMATPAGGRSGAPPSNLPATFANQTVRMIVRTSLGGSRVRVELSNMLNAQLHVFSVWRNHLNESVPLLFQGNRKTSSGEPK